MPKRNFTYTSEFTPPSNSVSTSIFVALRIARLYRHRMPTFEELMTEKALASNTATVEQAGDVVGWIVESEKAGFICLERFGFAADKVIADAKEEYGDAYGATTKRPLYAQPCPVGAPDGWKLVPPWTNWTMRKALRDALPGVPGDTADHALMLALAAAPAPAKAGGA